MAVAAGLRAPADQASGPAPRRCGASRLRDARTVSAALMRVVLDTNVLVSAVVFGGVPGEIVEMAASRELTLVLSPALVDELRRVLRDKFTFSEDALYLTETLLRQAGILIEPSQSLGVITEDPHDNRVLEAAVYGGADAIVSGDRHLLVLKEFQGVPIMSPRQFLSNLRRRKPADR